MVEDIQIIHKKGRHRSRPFILKRRKVLKYRVTFTESCRYDHGDHDQLDWNKLMGLKECYFRPMYNSEMGCWRYVVDKIEYGQYMHINGTRVVVPLGFVEIGGSLEYEITAPKKYWVLSPWFGGQKKAPHDIRLEIKIL